MLFKSRNKVYTDRFISHLSNFVSEYKLFDKNASLLVTVSGGIDSICILYSLYLLENYGYSNQLRVVHINHGTRIEHDDEQRFVNEFCNYLGIECNSFKIKDLDINSNFENKARIARYSIFEKVRRKNEKIVLAHHIDDSFEWTLLQSLRSSNIEGMVGIPLVNGNVIRPFMCVSKQQIHRFAACFDLPFLEDPTNEELRFERNFIRNKIVEGFKDRYPQYLKHYVYRHNEFARRIELHFKNKSKSAFKLAFEPDSVLVYAIKSQQDFSGIEQLILEALKYLNPDTRGTISKSIKQIVQGMKNNKYGPMTLTRGVKAYLDFNSILLVRKKYTFKPVKQLPSFQQVLTYEEYQNHLEDYLGNTINNDYFPFWVLVKSHNFSKGGFDSAFNPKQVEFMKNSGQNYFSALKLLREWSKKQHRHKKLKLHFLA